MSCSCCCTNTLDFCKQEVCGEIDFDIKAQLAGVHKLVTYFMGTKVTLTAEFEVDDNIIFPVDTLNESYEYTGELYDPTDTKIVIRKGGTDYDCVKFKTVIAVVS